LTSAGTTAAAGTTTATAGATTAPTTAAAIASTSASASGKSAAPKVGAGLKVYIRVALVGALAVLSL
jgi:hypothetical protein